MDINQLMIQSLQLLGLGMGAVFIILLSLIVIITLVSKLVPEELPPSVNSSSATRNNTKNDHVAAISAAVRQYRQKS